MARCHYPDEHKLKVN